LLDAANIQLLCATCHGRKTAAERNKRMATRW
jgi:cytochrome c553